MVAPGCTPTKVSMVTFPMMLPLKFLQYALMLNSKVHHICQQILQIKQRCELKQVIWYFTQVVYRKISVKKSMQ